MPVQHRIPLAKPSFRGSHVREHTGSAPPLPGTPKPFSRWLFMLRKTTGPQLYRLAPKQHLKTLE